MASHSNYTRLAINKGDIQDDGDAGTVCTTTSTLHPPAIFNRATAETKQLAGGIKPTAGGEQRKEKASSRRKPLKTLDSNQKATASGSKEKRKASSPNIEYEVPANGAKNAISPIAVSPVSDVRTKRRIDNWSVGLRSVAIKLLFGIRFRSGKDLSDK